MAEHVSLDALTAVVRGRDLGDLVDNDFVVSVSSDAIVRPHGLLGGLLGLVGGLAKGLTNVLLANGAGTSGPAVAPLVLRQTLGVNNSTWAGRGVGVAVIDSGLQMTSDFSGRVTAFYDFTKGGIVSSYPYDDHGHGTHIAGTIGGSGARSNNEEYRGLAPGVKLVVLKVLDKDGAGYTSDVIRAVRAGVIGVASAGNHGKNPETGLPGYAGVTSPGNAPSAITVGAVKTLDTVVRSDDRIADYSSAGPT